MMYGLETMSLTKRHEEELEVGELKMLRFLLGVTRMDKIRNTEYIRGTVQVDRFVDKAREARLRWFSEGLWIYQKKDVEDGIIMQTKMGRSQRRRMRRKKKKKKRFSHVESSFF